ncbi:protein AF-17 isoform X2 [Rhinatrema bivittatum]|uniref:protein AF-17 isoform X2 n=1 Tax=Rhinatrema bivittatum TaxID=194408 RepID=UPI001127EFFE|nr:protein AF-17 isoform X2 [Rhinatrema bivittatum]
MKEMVGGCCVCSDERGWAENPLVYCDGHGCSVAVHQACYGIVQVPTGPWFCRKCESQERAARVRCELCPHKDGALKRTDNGGWAHVVCALYIPEVQFANVLTMEPIVLQYVPHDRFNKTCYICEEQGRESKAASGACMTCNRHGCRQAFHVTCAQMAGLLCEEEALEVDNVKYIGYCKYHFNKMKTSRHSGGCPYIPARRSRSVSPAQEKPAPHHERQKKSRKDKERPKQKHRKHPQSPSLLTPSIIAPAEKVSSSYHDSSKDSAEVSRSEVKAKKTLSHGINHKGKKTGSGKSSSNFSSTAAGSSFQPGTSCSSVPPLSQDFVTFPKLEQEEEKPRKPVCSSHSSPSHEGPKSEVFEHKVTLSNFGSIMRFSTTSVNHLRDRDTSPVDYKSSNPVSSPSGGGHKRMPSLSIEDGTEILKEKKHRGSKKNKHGPGRPKGSKNKETSASQLTGATVTASSPFSGGSIISSSISSCSRSFTSTGTLPSLSLESSLLTSGIYTSNKDPISHGGGVLRAACSTPLSSSVLSQQGSSSLLPLNRPSFASTIPASSSSVSTTQVFSLAGPNFSIPSSHIFGSPLTSGPSFNPLLTRTDNIRTEPDLEDCSFVCRGSSPRESLSSMSPISSLPTLFEQTAPCSSSQLENVPSATPNIEQLLEKHGNGEAGVNIVEMLKALHSLQKENQQLQEQIMSLTAKKERLQHLNVQLSVPFPLVSASNGPLNHAHYLLPPNACNHDALSISKSPPSKNSFRTDNSLSASSEDPHSGCQSRSSSSLSFHSTPPPLPLPQQNSNSVPLPGITGISQQQQLVNGLARVTGNALGSSAGTVNHTISNLPMVGSLLGNLAASQQQLSVNGILGNVNGTIQTAGAVTQSQNSVTQSSGPPALQLSTNMNSMPGLNTVTEQQRHLLHQHEQQLQQLQQLLASSQLTPEQQNLVYQMMQQIQQRRELQRLQIAGASQLPIANLLTATTTALLHAGTNLLTSSNATPLHTGNSLMTSISPQLTPGNSLMTSSTAPPLLPGSNLMTSVNAGNSLMTSAAISAGPPILKAQTNPFFSLQAESSIQKGTRVNEKSAPINQDKG